MKHEIVVPLTKVELRAQGDGQILDGIAAVYNAKSELLGGSFREILMPGCFTKTLTENPAIKALWNHDSNYVLGSRKSKTLELQDSPEGLRFSVQLPNTQYARDFAETVKRGDVDQCSFMFDCMRDRWGSDGEERLRSVIEARLYEVSPVAFPAYAQTSVSAREQLAAEMRSAFEAFEAGEKGDEDELRALVAQLSAVIWIDDEDEEEEPQEDPAASAQDHPAASFETHAALDRVDQILELLEEKA